MQIVKNRKRKILTGKFFNRPTVLVAEELLGKYLVRKYSGCEYAYTITEVEAYDGFKDRGSHASRGITKRNFPMYGVGGYWYVYFTYGMHWMLNIVTERKYYPAAVLIRGLEGISGPGRVTKKMHVDGKQNNKPAAPESSLWIEDRGSKINKKFIKRKARIGIDYAGTYWARRKWRIHIDPQYFKEKSG
ncbi:MAG: DNA-3-methyladenine glycosylase [Candidatus Liptonbacteria bacterium]